MHNFQLILITLPHSNTNIEKNLLQRFSDLNVSLLELGSIGILKEVEKYLGNEVAKSCARKKFT